VITLDIRHAITRAIADAGYEDAAYKEVGDKPAPGIDPGLRPGGRPGQYTSSVAFVLAGKRDKKQEPYHVAHRLAVSLATENEWIAQAEATSQGYLTITVAPDMLTILADRISAAGPGCARSDALAGVTIPAPLIGAWETAATWPQARDALSAELAAALAVAAGATITKGGRGGDGMKRSGDKGTGVAAAVAFAGTDAVRFSLARIVPGHPVRVDPQEIARHVPDNPAYAVRYAHARAAAGVRWAAALGTGEAGPQAPPADRGDLALLDVLSWLPERVAIAARRSRPDEFARYLEDMASVTLATLTSPGNRRVPGNDRLALAVAARTGLAAGLELLGVSAPDRLLDGNRKTSNRKTTSNRRRSA
jgi:arginyl-tRNA synthetase